MAGKMIHCHTCTRRGVRNVCWVLELEREAAAARRTELEVTSRRGSCRVCPATRRP